MQPNHPQIQIRRLLNHHQHPFLLDQFLDYSIEHLPHMLYVFNCPKDSTSKLVVEEVLNELGLRDFNYGYKEWVLIWSFYLDFF